MDEGQKVLSFPGAAAQCAGSVQWARRSISVWGREMQDCGSKAGVGLGLQQVLWVMTMRSPPCASSMQVQAHTVPLAALELCAFSCAGGDGLP